MTIDKVKQLVASQLGKPLEIITDDARLIEDLGADSLDIMEMLMVLEDQFNITILDEEVEKMKTIAGIAQVVGSKLEN